MSTPVKLLIGAVGLVAIYYGLRQMGVIPSSTPANNPAQSSPSGPGAVGTLQTNPTGVAQQQTFTAQWAVANGDVQLNSGSWANNANVAVQSVDMECDQYDQKNTDLAQKHITLYTQNQTPLPAGDAEQFNSIDIGPAAQGVAAVKCGILDASTGQ
jgi:hypothetical protein